MSFSVNWKNFWRERMNDFPGNLDTQNGWEVSKHYINSPHWRSSGQTGPAVGLPIFWIQNLTGSGQATFDR